MKLFFAFLALMASLLTNTSVAMERTESKQIEGSQELDSPGVSEERLKAWFMELMWREFVKNRDPRLASKPVSYEELDLLVEETKSRGGAITIQVEDLAILLEHREKLCTSQDTAYGVDLQKGFHFR